jgi:hypothetical protein
VQSAELDGVAVDAHAIPLQDDGETHEVVIVLGVTRRRQVASATTREQRRPIQRA